MLGMVMKKVLQLLVLVCTLTVLSYAQFNGVMIAQAPLASGGQTGTVYTDIVNNVFNNATVGSLASSIKGVTPIVCWNVVDTGATSMSLNWTTLDANLNAWISNGATSIGMIVAPALEGGNNNCTPPYVFTQTYATAIGAAAPQYMTVSANYAGNPATSPFGNANGATGCGTGCEYNITQCITGGCTFGGGDTTGLPVSLPGQPIATAWPAFITQFFIHFSASCASGVGTTDCANVPSILSHLKYVKFGMTQGGEASVLGLNFWTVPAAYASFAIAYAGTSSVSPAVPVCNVTGTGNVKSYIESMYITIGSLIVTYAPAWGVIESMHSNGNPQNSAYSDCEALYSTQNKFGFGTNGLQNRDAANYASGDNDVDDTTSCISDWCFNFNLYFLNGTINYLQTLTTTDPTNGTGAPAAASASSATGSLTYLLSFAAQRHAKVAEIYSCDALFAFTTTWAGLPATGNPGTLTNCASWYNRSSGGIIASTLGSGGATYAIGDKGTVTCGNNDATYIVTSVSGTAVFTFSINQTGTACTTGNGVATVATSGSGTGFTINISGVSGSAGSYNVSGGGAGVNNPYAQAIANFTNQAPNGTANMAGKATVTGKASVQ
jgi:hypothetical protein